jgi:hypothetical protein
VVVGRGAGGEAGDEDAGAALGQQASRHSPAGGLPARDDRVAPGADELGEGDSTRCAAGVVTKVRDVLAIDIVAREDVAGRPVGSLVLGAHLGRRRGAESQSRYSPNDNVSSASPGIGVGQGVDGHGGSRDALD